METLGNDACSIVITAHYSRKETFREMRDLYGAYGNGKSRNERNSFRKTPLGAKNAPISAFSDIQLGLRCRGSGIGIN
jgi:hypothetical protein